MGVKFSDRESLREGSQLDDKRPGSYDKKDNRGLFMFLLFAECSGDLGV